MSPEILSYVTQNFTMCNTQRKNDGKLQKKKKLSVDSASSISTKTS